MVASRTASMDPERSKETLNKYSISTDLQARVRRNLAEGL
jgi:hypothetical protein